MCPDLPRVCSDVGLGAICALRPVLGPAGLLLGMVELRAKRFT